MIRANDIRYTYRSMVKRYRLTLLTILVMATGLGLSVYLFAMLHIQVFKDLPFKDGDSLVQVYALKDGARNSGTSLLHDIDAIKKNVKSLQEFSIFRNVNLNVTGADGARRFNAVKSEPNIFQLTRTEPLHGRTFSAAENQVGSENVVVIGHSFWKNYYSGDVNAIGQLLRINGEQHKVIGIMPENYYFPVNAELWVPIRENAEKILRADAQNVFGLAHIKAGFIIDDVNKEIGLVMKRLEDRYPKTNSGVGAYVEFIPRSAAGDGIAIGYSLQVIAFMILILAAVNVGNLLLARTIERGKETAIRIALGAPRSRLISQILLETIIICVLGAILGVIALKFGLDLTEKITYSYSIDRPPFWWDFRLDQYALTLAAAFFFLTVVVVSIFPVWKSFKMDFNAALRDGTRGAQGRNDGRLNRILVMSEIFVTLTVLIAASVMAFVNQRALDADYGVDTSNAITAEILLSEASYQDAPRQAEFVETLHSRLTHHNGIHSAVIASALPGQYAQRLDIAIDGFEYSSEDSYAEVNYIATTVDTFQDLGVALVAGRYFNHSDKGLSKATVVVSASFAERFFSEGSAVGKRLRFVSENNNDFQWLTIVGVVGHTIQGSSLSAHGKLPNVFRPISQAPQSSLVVALKTSLSIEDSTKALREAVSSISPDLPVFKVETYDEKIERHTRPLEFITNVFLVFGLAAAVLAGSGIYGVLSNAILQKTQEVGVKRAFGATDKDIYIEFFKHGLKQFLIGGIPGAIVGSLMAFGMMQVFPVYLIDVIVIAFIVIALVLGVVLCATYIPTKRALSMEPVDAIRYE
ncbi:ABC transporter permease [Pseudoalteromonas luteoviolacea]|uniref:ABC transporter permease n=1 Tax=Pseudoalteromonas luteoviolacea TaxID=43657 RepID=UPI001B392486|nr:ABC transporter permease [Pseudoalteromonas luteoviolacea]MBQ4813846.1 ABC transporter permease [Pseudoalteromonas luteoviolacea]